MKKLIFCVFFIIQCMNLFAMPANYIYLRLVNNTGDYIIVNLELNPEFFGEWGGPASIDFFLEDSEEPINGFIYADNRINENISPSGRIHILDMIKTEKLLTLPLLEIFNTVISSLCVTDSSGNILLTEKDVTNDSFIKDVGRYDVIFTIEVKKPKE